jgi:O-antigen/teichoic acid export membrane protein
VNTRKILVDTLHLSGLRIWSITVALGTMYVTAAVLGRRGFGVLAAFALIPQLSTYGSLGWDSAAMRELPHLHGSGNAAAAARVRSTAYTAELLMTAAWMVVAAVVALAMPTLRVGVLLGALSLLVAKFTRFFVIDAFVAKDFRIQARVGMVTVFAAAVLQVLGAWRYGALGAFAGLVAANAIGLSTYWLRRSMSWHLGLDWPELRRLSAIGWPMALLGLVSGTTGASAYLERGLIGSIAGLSTLGLYAFGVSLNNYLIAFVGDFSRTYQPHLLEALAQSTSGEALARWLTKPALGVSYAASILASAMLAVLPVLVRLLLPAYEPVLAVLPVLFCAGLISCLTYIPAMFLNSAAANQQAYYTKLWTAGLLLYAGVLWAVLHEGFGLAGAAWAAIIPPLFVVSFAIPKAYSYYVAKRATAMAHAARLLAPIVLVVGVHAIARATMSRYAGAMTGRPVADEALIGALALTITAVPLLTAAWHALDGARLAERLRHPEIPA